MHKHDNLEMPREDDLNPQVTFEARDIRARQVVAWGGVLVLVLLASQLIVWRTLRWMQADQVNLWPSLSPLLVGRPVQLPPEPRLQGAPGHPATGPEDLRQVVTRANAKLDTYGWVDQTTGVAHIPIRQAMDMIVQSGLPAVPPPTSAAKTASPSKPAATAKPAAAPTQPGAKGTAQ